MERDANLLKLRIGDEAPYFSLKGTDEKIHSIENFKEKQALIVVFTCNHCPYAQAYESRLIELANTYQPLGAQFVAICANDSVGYPEDSFSHMVAKSKELNLPYPFLQDETQVVARAYDAQCTPETYVFDKDRKLCYHGRIDDNHKDPTAVKSRDLHDAIEAVLAGETPKQPLTPCIGCSIKWK